jgi:hypothetical protein
MSALRDVRLLIARHLDLPQNVRAGILDVLNLLDADLDVQGYQDSTGAVTEAIQRLDRIILGDDDDIEDVDAEDELFDTRVSLTDLVQRISTGDDDEDDEDE